MNTFMKDLLLKVKTVGAKQDATSVLAEIEALGSQTNANEVMHTTNTGMGKELIPSEVMGASILDMIPQYSYLLSSLPGNQGSGLNLKEVLPVVGEADLFDGNTEWTTGSNAITPSGKKVATGSVAIEQGQFILEIAVSKRELAYSVEALEPLLRERISMSAARTIDAFLLNADNATSGNMNTSATPDATAYYMQGAEGLRKVGLANSLDIGTFDDTDILALADKLGDYASDPTQCVIVVNRKVYNKMLGFTNVKTYDKFNTNATIQKGVLANIFGFDVMVARDMPALALATGKVHATTGNDYGTLVMFYKPAVQYGFGKIEDFEVTAVAGR